MEAIEQDLVAVGTEHCASGHVYFPFLVSV
jgi:hypothetical protein